ncbi:MAG: hypothetical protein ACD_25C00069G0008 [uncultured bacterium]|nr:hypothetical protein P147_WWE3C00001G0896 [candidate division WWE3 bacterium RAAC2_WWE3_1]EKD95115.1 MAG: hypothetical protein ACD_25C00069G0008 [uncultured bacterium]KKS29491.1 MAG: hypothetical protein UU91_C0005G0023 [candidate division WWE3 bacterium GW2011_GWB1_42_117]KKS54903.1 MAG: hypothetical protein UV21_C0004G0068 [candidate division WWE3 bacterium GW2011_GWD2_42_34]KKT05519.1 MAG: hypothetical protein UV83_C0003G0074 [candidate division WWE3 bacterium GW2011_GWE2_43_18]KKT06728.
MSVSVFTLILMLIMASLLNITTSIFLISKEEKRISALLLSNL